ncbi:MAG: hypothetical protein J5920_00435 [Candidatus Methanomethylophilaceae archaeon]|nr:hypothetical protein [Candidatus Methanomethylophilaceae archaeon]
MIDDIVRTGGSRKLFEDPEALKEAVKGFMGMFDREIFDCIVTCKGMSSMFAAIMADRLNSSVLIGTEGITKGTKVIVIMDELRSGECAKKLITGIEAKGGEVIRIGFISEIVSEGARKSKILRGYPFEALVTI